VLGMRLVKKTVNQDDVSAYHLFYGDVVGHAGTEVTFFDWPNAGPNRAGTRSIAAIGLRVPDRAVLDWWLRRFTERGVAHGDIAEQGGCWTLPFRDPEGQQLELVAEPAGQVGGMQPGEPWEGSPVPAEMQIRGLHHVTLIVEEFGPTVWVLTKVLGFRQARDYPAPANPARPVVVFETGPGGAGTEVHVVEQPELPTGRVGIGGVHHVAFRTPNDAEHVQWRDHIAGARIGITDVIDRYYFKSLYFREPGGILFEIATDGPGFAVDEDPAHLGERLVLPPFLEPHRAKIEAGLRPLDRAV
jgi:glyoxalase family protein